MTKNSMTKAMRILGVTSLLMTGATTAMEQNDAGGVSSKAVTGTQTGASRRTPRRLVAQWVRHPPKPRRPIRVP